MHDIRILIAKDAETDISSIQEILVSEGYLCDAATELEDIQKKVDAHHYAMIFYLPPPPARPPRGVWAFLKEYSLRVPVLFCAPADYTVQDYSLWLEAGMDHYLSLPVTKAQLLSTIHAVVTEKNNAPCGGPDAEKARLRLSDGRKIEGITLARLGHVVSSAFDNCAHHQQVLKKTYKKTHIIEEMQLSTSAFSHRTKERIKREEELIAAIEKREFEMFYQPIVSLEKGRITGFESLVRWKHPERGYVSPTEFIPLAEETGLILSLGLLAVEMTSARLSEWNAGVRKHDPVSASVNLSTVQFIDPQLADQIEVIADAQNLEREFLRFEITESAIMADMESANIMLLKLKSKKHKIYMDDFGTGYSSLSYLRHFPVDVLKIDQSFVKWMGVDEESDTIVKTIIELAHNLRMEVVAEGIETEEHLSLLRSMNCDYGQGYFFSKPVEAAVATELLQNDPVW